MTSIERAEFIATVAHTGQGQYRADGATPFIVHPRRVADLVTTWGLHGLRSSTEYMHAVAAAWLHDVVEDTKVTLANLREWGVDARTVEIVDLLTKKNKAHEAETDEYYQAISHDDTALLVKAADRSANIEDALLEVQQSRELKRWRNYVARTYSDVLPMYATLPELRAELETRLKAIEDALLRVRGVDPDGAFDCGLPVPTLPPHEA